MKLTILREERRLSKKKINNIYKKGDYIKHGCFTINWLKSNSNSPKICLLISVPKKNISKAVKRNYIKRIIRESYKINKPFICNLLLSPADIILTYNKNTMPKFNTLETELLTLFKLISKK
tara:strand:+ start:113 stop:475 length:363 start_codon:yes stop_codon:yes gene_type:complete